MRDTWNEHILLPAVLAVLSLLVLCLLHAIHVLTSIPADPAKRKPTPPDYMDGSEPADSVGLAGALIRVGRSMRNVGHGKDSGGIPGKFRRYSEGTPGNTKGRPKPTV